MKIQIDLNNIDEETLNRLGTILDLQEKITSCTVTLSGLELKLEKALEYFDANVHKDEVIGDWRYQIKSLSDLSQWINSNSHRDDLANVKKDFNELLKYETYKGIAKTIHRNFRSFEYNFWSVDAMAEVIEMMDARLNDLDNSDQEDDEQPDTSYRGFVPFFFSHLGSLLDIVAD
jgi:hypothetical protein